MRDMEAQKERESRIIGHYLVRRMDHPRSSGLHAEHFCIAVHKTWWNKALSLDEFDATSLGIPLEDWDRYDRAGAYLSPKELVAIIAKMRRNWAGVLVQESLSTSMDALRRGADLDEVCKAVSVAIESARAGYSDGGKVLSDVMSSVAEEWAEACRAGAPNTLPMPVSALQSSLLGWRIGKLHMLGAKSSEHKTTFGRSACEAVARVGESALYWLMEDDASDLGARTLASKTDVNTAMLGTGTTDKPDSVTKRKASMDRIASDPAYRRIIVIDRRSPPISAIGPEIGKAVAQHGVKFVVLDFVQLIQPDKGNKSGDWWSHLSAHLHTLASTHNVALLCLGQFETTSVRDMAETGRSPRITDMYGGDTWRQNAFGCLVMWKTSATTLSFRVDKWKGGSAGIEIANVPVVPAHDRIG